MLRDDIREFVKRAQSQGAKITFSEYATMIHIWFALIYTGTCDNEAKQALDEWGQFIANNR